MRDCYRMRNDSKTAIPSKTHPCWLRVYESWNSGAYCVIFMLLKKSESVSFGQVSCYEHLPDSWSCLRISRSIPNYLYKLGRERPSASGEFQELSEPSELFSS